MTEKFNIGNTVWVQIPDDGWCAVASAKIVSTNPQKGVFHISPEDRKDGELDVYFLCEFREEHLFHTQREALVWTRDTLVSYIKIYEGKIDACSYLLMHEDVDDDVDKLYDNIKRYRDLVDDNTKKLVKVNKLLRELE